MNQGLTHTHFSCTKDSAHVSLSWRFSFSEMYMEIKTYAVTMERSVLPNFKGLIKLFYML